MFEVRTRKYGPVKGKVYCGSAKDCRKLKQSDHKVYILSEHSEYSECLKMEQRIHVTNKVVSDIRFFNRGIACVNNYHNPDYGTFKHISGLKYARLRLNDPDVNWSDWVGTTKGVVYSEERKKKSSMKKEKHPLWGSTMSEETKQKISASNKTLKDRDPDRYAKKIQKMSENALKTFSGTRQTEEHVRKRTKDAKYRRLLKHIDTGEIWVYDIRHTDESKIDKSVWVCTYKYSCIKGTAPKDTCKYCGLTAQKSSIAHWHNEKCKHKPKE